MPTKCAVCNNPTALVESCVTCKMQLCRECVSLCKMCGETLCPNHVHVTSRGKQLCPSCRDERRREKERRREESAAGASAGVAGGAAVGAAAGVAVAAKDKEPGDMSFAALQADVDETAPTPEKIQEKLKELDRSKPILSASAYRPPSKLSHLLAFLFFGVSGIILFVSFPDVRGIMWPFEGSEFAFERDMAPQIKDTNSLRNTTNISNFKDFFHIPFFLIAWGFVIAYAYGVVIICIPLLGILIPRARHVYDGRRIARRAKRSRR